MSGNRLRSRTAFRKRARDLFAWSSFIQDPAGHRTSVTDGTSYTTVCERAAHDPDAFATFKSHPDYTPVLEHVTCAQGAQYLRIALEQSPPLEPLLERFRENDRLGGPQVCDYEAFGPFSPTTLRYIKVVSDLLTLFGSLEGFTIIEIGAGYGGQCYVTSTAAHPRYYILIDLDPCLALQRAYLAQLGVSNVLFGPAEELASEGRYDLVVSNYAFSECTRATQEDYLTRVLQRSERGYITCNWIAPGPFRSMTPDELLAAVPGSRLLPEVPLTAPDNQIWVWGAD